MPSQKVINMIAKNSWFYVINWPHFCKQEQKGWSVEKQKESTLLLQVQTIWKKEIAESLFYVESLFYIFYAQRKIQM